MPFFYASVTHVRNVRCVTVLENRHFRYIFLRFLMVSSLVNSCFCWKGFDLLCMLGHDFWMIDGCKTAFITGITGQDGAYLSALLLSKGYRVHGLVRWDSYVDPVDGMQRLNALGLVDERVQLHMGDVTDANNITRLIKEIQPDEIYNLAALSQVGVSFETPSSTLDINAKGTLNILDAVRVLGVEHDVRIYQASSSEMFGSAPAPQNEATPFEPCSPYGVAKLAGYWFARNYRDAYGMHVSNGILFNHESPLRGEDFVTRKITKAVAAIEAGVQDELRLGNLDSVRDWGSSQDYVRGMWMMVQRDCADDYVLASGQGHSVREFVEAAFEKAGVFLVWKGAGVDEIGVDAKTNKVLVRVDPAFFRPKDVHHLLGDASKARDVLGWQVETGFDALVSMMVDADRKALNTGRDVGDKPWSMAG